MTRIDSPTGRAVLMIANCAGMLDLVALPVWVSALMGWYKFDPQQAGLLPTLFLGSAVVSSLAFARFFNRVPARLAASLGYGVAGLAFAALSTTTSYPSMTALHAIAGAAAGCGLSFTHGTIGRGGNPHRLFALAGLALGIFAIAFMGTTPGLIVAFGGPVLFRVFTAVMLVATLASAIAFPVPDTHRTMPSSLGRLNTGIRFGMLGVASLALVQAMTFSFVQRIGLSLGFGLTAVTGVLLAVGIVNLFPPPLAALLERRLSPQLVLVIGPLLQAGLSFIITHVTSFAPYACAVSVFVGVTVFTYTYAFGVIALLDQSGRAAAATPAMMMAGAALGPILGGTLVKYLGFGSLGIVAMLIAAFALSCFLRLTSRPEPLETPA